jgi:hypothetical protein
MRRILKRSKFKGIEEELQYVEEDLLVEEEYILLKVN